MRSKLRTASSLTAADWLDLGRAWLLLLVFDAGVRLLPFPRVRAFAARQASPRALEMGGAEAARLARLVAMAARLHPWPMGCLRRALALQRLLGQRGVHARLRIGVRKRDGGLDAHAWLEMDGAPVGEHPDRLAAFVPLSTRGADG